MTTTAGMAIDHDPRRVLAHAERVGDRRLAALLRRRLLLLPVAAQRAVECLCRSLGL